MNQCSGLTKRGERCQRKILTDKCYQHTSNSDDYLTFLFLLSMSKKYRFNEKYADIDVIPRKLEYIFRIISNSLTQDKKECFICYNNTNLYILKCKHEICSKCILRCTTCPYCRENINPFYKVINKLVYTFECNSLC